MAKNPDQPTAEPIEGGPAATPSPEPTPVPRVVTVKYGGRDLQVPEDVASAWQEREREFDQRLSKQGQELGQLRERWKSIETQVQPKPAEPDINTLWFENPAKAAEFVETRVETKLRQEYEQRERAREQQAALDRFFDGFYRKNDDLREDDWVVKGVMSEHFDELADLPPAKAQEKLADLTRERIIRLTRKVKVSEPDNPRSRAGLSEPASGERPSRPAARDEDEGPASITGLLKARVERRHAAARGRTAAR